MINRIGTIVKIISTENSEVFETLDGYHVNSTEEVKEAEDYLIPTPTRTISDEEGNLKEMPMPYSLFFGIPAEDTFFYKFSTKEECDSIIGEESLIADSEL